MTQRRPPTHYSEAENAAILAAANSGIMGKDKWTAVAEELGTGRSWQSCRQQSLILRRKENPDANRRQKRVYNPMQEPPAPDAVPEYTSITAAFFKDPLPGRSALDKMRAGLA